MSKSKILFISDRSPRHDTDETFETIGKSFDDYTFLYVKRGYPFHPKAWSERIVLGEPFSEEALTDVDYVYARVDHYHEHFKSGMMFELLDKLPDAKLIFAYHCHTATPFDFEREAFERADSLVLINNASKEYFNEVYPCTKNKPVFILPSLFLPPKAWYGTFPKKPITSNKTRISFAAAAHNLIPNHRYNDIEQIRTAANTANMEVDVFGGYDSEKTFDEYARVEGNVRFYGRAPEEHLDFMMLFADFSPMNGFLPGTETGVFEHLNYALRMNTLIKTCTQPIIAQGTSTYHEKEALETGFGVIYSSLDIFEKLHEIKEKNPITEETWKLLVDRHSFDTYADDLADFIKNS